MKVGIILGTRPEIIKCAPVIKMLEKRNVDYFVVHSGQHYSPNMDGVFFRQLMLKNPRYKIKVGSMRDTEQIAVIIDKAGRVLQRADPDVVLVQGDTNTVLAGALAAKKSCIPVGHIEAGLRSFDDKMPEETNRILTDHCSEFLFAPTKNAYRNLLGEGIDRKKITVTGNTIVDSINQNLGLIREQSVLDRLGVHADRYCLLSLHRRENVDDKATLQGIVRGIKMICRELRSPVIFPAHPRTKKRAEEFGIAFDPVVTTEPADYLSFLALQKNAMIVITDSGGVQEESCILNTPCITVRTTTERPETVDVGANIVAGTRPHAILSASRKILSGRRRWKNPFGDGHAAETIVDTILKSGW